MLSLNIQKRESGDRLETIRAAGNIPGVLYGKKEESMPITLSAKDFSKVWKEAGESSVITLSGVGSVKEALIHDVDLDPVKGGVRHVDLYVIEKGQKVSVHVPLSFDGVAPAEKLGAVLVKVLHEIEVEAGAADLPHELTVDISKLTEVDAQILAKDITLPKGVTLVTDGDEVVALAAPATEETEEATPMDISAIELSEERGKKPEEEEAAE